MNEPEGIKMTEEKKTENAAGETPLVASEYPMTGLALLALPAWEPAMLRESLLSDWQIDPGEPPASVQEPWIFTVDGSLVVIGLEPHPVPDNAADLQAKNSPEWPGAVEAAQTHQAYLAVAVIAQQTSLVENARTAVKILGSLSSEPNVRAVNAASRLYSPEAYRKGALAMKQNERVFPIFNLIFFGVWTPVEGGRPAGYTVGLDRFGAPEVEILESPLQPMELRAQLVHAAMMQISRGRSFDDGEEIELGGVEFRAARKPSVALPDVITSQLEPVKA